MKRRFAGVAALLLLAGCGGGAPGGTTSSSASCVAPSLSATPTSVHPGDDLRVTGDYFFATCNDTAANGGQPAEPEPLTGLTVLLRQGDRTWTLAQDVDAHGRLWSIDATAPVPTDVAAGEAEVLVEDHGRPAAVTVLP